MLTTVDRGISSDDGRFKLMLCSVSTAESWFSTIAEFFDEHDIDPGPFNSLNSIYVDLSLGGKELWLGFVEDELSAVAITQRVEHGIATVLHFVVAGGRNLDCFAWAMEKITEFAKIIGCQYVEASGRPGWEKLLKKQGFEKLAVQFIKEL